MNEKLEDDFIFLSERFTLDTNTRSITQKLPRKNQLKRTDSNREYTEISLQGMMNSDVAFGTVESLKKNEIPQVKQKLQSRLDSFRSDTFLNMKWSDPANWDSESNTEIEILKKLAEIFTVILSSSQNAACTFNVSKLAPEWKEFKHMVKIFYSGIKASVL